MNRERGSFIISLSIYMSLYNPTSNIIRSICNLFYIFVGNITGHFIYTVKPIKQMNVKTYNEEHLNFKFEYPAISEEPAFVIKDTM